MSSSFLSLRAVTRCVFLSVFCLPYLVSAHAQSTVSAADLAKLQENINAMRTQYEQRISALEEKLKSLQQQNTSLEKKSTTTTPPIALPTEIKPQRASNEPKNLAPGPALHSGLSLPKIGSFTPEISLIIDGKYSNQTQNPDAAMQGFIPSGASNIPRGFSLGETELVLAGTVDNLFRAEARLVLSQNANGTSVNAEEVFFETLGLPVGLKLKAGKYFSSIGYLNSKHPHEWDFVNLPLAYQAFLGGQLNDTGAQVNWVAPIDEFYLRFGAEYGQGTAYPSSNNYNQNKPGLFTAYLKAGSDLSVSSSWLGGLSYVQATTGDDPRNSDLGYGQTYSFSGTTNIYIADLVFKWAPNGNPSRQNLKLQAEAFWNNQNGHALYNSSAAGSMCEFACQGGSYRNMQSGFYAQAIYQFAPNWRIGYRYDQLYSGKSSYGFSPNTLDGTSLDSWNPNRNTLMLDWANSEYSLVRLQLARDTAFGPGLVNNQVFLQYIMSLGSHGAHRY